jgi:hypothetical protein
MFLLYFQNFFYRIYYENMCIALYFVLLQQAIIAQQTLEQRAQQFALLVDKP